MAVASSDHLQLVAAALTSLIPGSKVITKDDPLYATLKEPQPLTYELLSQNVIVESRPEPEPGLVVPFEETELDAEAITGQTSRRSLLIAIPVEKFIMTAQFLNGQSYRFSVDPRATVYALKWSIFKSKGFDEYTQYDVNNIVLTFEGNELNDDDRLLTDCGIKYMSTVTVAVKLKGGAGPTVLVLEEDFLEPVFNYDLTHVCDDGTVYKRGTGEYTYEYKRPYGWNRIALNVYRKYPDDTWLGAVGIRTESTPGEWPVSYHGTANTGAEGITEKGYLKQKLIRDLHGKGFYSTPDINVAASVIYAEPFPFKDKQYQAVMQNRVNLSPGHTKIIPKEKTGAGAEYFVTESPDDIRAYGICIREYNQ